MLEFWLCFVPLFVAVDAIGTMPMFMNFTSCLGKAGVRRVIVQSLWTAMGVALAFLAIGHATLALLGVTVADFMVAGGILLFALSLRDMLALEKRKMRMDPDSLGAVPIGVPLIVGPAVLTTSILLVSQFGFALTAACTALNVLLAGVIFSMSDLINRVLGKAGAKTVSKLASLILAAIAVMMVRKGFVLMIAATAVK